MAKAAQWLERVAGIFPESVCRGGLDRKDMYSLQASGRHLSYTLKTDGGWIFLSVQPMDTGDPPEILLITVDGPLGWQTSCNLVRALERSGISKLQPRPLELGEPGSKDCWVIS